VELPLTGQKHIVDNMARRWRLAPSPIERPYFYYRLKINKKYLHDI
jgi:hypothetical protein